MYIHNGWDRPILVVNSFCHSKFVIDGDLIIFKGEIRGFGKANYLGLHSK